MSTLRKYDDSILRYRFGLDAETGRLLEVHRQTGEVVAIDPDYDRIVYGATGGGSGPYYNFRYQSFGVVVEVGMLIDFLEAHADLLVDDDDDGVATMPDDRLLFPISSSLSQLRFEATDADEYISPSNNTHVFVHGGGGDDVIVFGLPPRAGGRHPAQRRHGLGRRRRRPDDRRSSRGRAVRRRGTRHADRARQADHP